jgi:hypothetical protein
MHTPCRHAHRLISRRNQTSTLRVSPTASRLELRHLTKAGRRDRSISAIQVASPKSFNRASQKKPQPIQCAERKTISENRTPVARPSVTKSSPCADATSPPPPMQITPPVVKPHLKVQTRFGWSP